MRRQPENNVSKRKVNARRVGTCFLQLRFEDHHMLVPMIDTGSDSLLVSVRWTVSHQCHKRVAPSIAQPGHVRTDLWKVNRHDHACQRGNGKSHSTPTIQNPHLRSLVPWHWD